MVKVGQKAPDLSLPAANGKITRLRDFRGKRVILYFYPKDHTPGCTQEACDFRDAYGRLRRLGAVVIGISPDNTKSQRGFLTEHNLPFLLLSDEDKKGARAFGAWKKKKLYGREFMGIIRTTVVIDPRSVVEHIFTNVRVAGHVDRVIAYLERGA